MYKQGVTKAEKWREGGISKGKKEGRKKGTGDMGRGRETGKKGGGREGEREKGAADPSNDEARSKRGGEKRKRIKSQKSVRRRTVAK